MFRFEYTYTDYELLIDAIAQQMGTQVRDGWLLFPPQYANGYIRYIKLPNGMQVNIFNCTINTDWFFNRKASDQEYYTLRFDLLTIPDKIEMGIGDDKVERQSGTFSAVYLTSSIYDWYYRAAMGSKLEGVNILITKEELAHQLGVDVIERMLPLYIALKSRSLNMEQLDSGYNQLIEEIINEDPDTPFPELYITNRVQLLVERFFTRVKSKINLASFEVKLKADDIQTIREVEKHMLPDFTKKPPSINELSRKAAMSATKFKNLFKAVYGVPVYEYYQQHRMQMAANLLTGSNETIKEIALKVGYHNISNFTTAFKKQFKKIPQEYKESYM
ncbi:MAG: helix-turn-helix domain-containing protein [Chitinophagaceae bacterium]